MQCKVFFYEILCCIALNALHFWTHCIVERIAFFLLQIPIQIPIPIRIAFFVT